MSGNRYLLDTNIIICASVIINEATLVTEDVCLHNGVVEKVVNLADFLEGT